MARAAIALGIALILAGCGAAPEKPLTAAEKEARDVGARRLAELKDMIAEKGWFRLNVGYSTNPFRSEPRLLLFLGEMNEQLLAACPNRAAVDAKQAAKIADYLAGARLLDTAASGLHEFIPVADPPCYSLSIASAMEGDYTVELGRDATSLEHLEALRALLDGDAAAKMDRVAGELRSALKLAADRRKALVDGIEDFGLELQYHGSQNKPFYDLTLSMKPINRTKSSPLILDAVIDKDTARRLIDWLEQSGALGCAGPDTRNMPMGPRSIGGGPRYTLYFWNGQSSYEWDLGWDYLMLRRLLALRALLKDDAAKQMDVLLGGLSDDIKSWTGKPYEPPK